MHTVGAIIVVGLGVFGLIWPRAAASFVRLAPMGQTGLSELRATYGGVFLGMGVTALVLNQPAAHMVIGVGFALAAAARAVSVVVDRSREPYNLAGIVFEAVIALLLLM